MAKSLLPMAALFLLAANVIAALLLQLRTEADAIMAGARTVDLFPVTMGPGGPSYRQQRLAKGFAEYNLRVIVSGSASVDPEAEIFRHRFSPIILLTTGQAPPERLRRLREAGAEIEICGEQELDFAEALHRLRERWKVKRLLCEGGGEINAALLEAGLVDEIYLTLCPLIFGGQTSPTLADGRGVEHLSDAIPLRLKSQRRWGRTLFGLSGGKHQGKGERPRTRRVSRLPDASSSLTLKEPVPLRLDRQLIAASRRLQLNPCGKCSGQRGRVREPFCRRPACRIRPFFRTRMWLKTGTISST